MMTHEYVPYDFRVSITIPIPKDPKVKGRLHNKSGNFRGISISPVISKVYEYCLMDKFLNLIWGVFISSLVSKKKKTQAIYTVQKTADYFTDRCSNVHLCTLDMLKEFDKLNRFVLFRKLMKRNCPFNLIIILVFRVIYHIDMGKYIHTACQN